MTRSSPRRRPSLAPAFVRARRRGRAPEAATRVHARAGHLAVAIVLAATILGAAGCGTPAPAGSPGSAGALGPAATVEPGGSGSATPGESPANVSTPSPAPSPTPTPTPKPTPVLVPAPLTGVLVTEAAAARHPIAVMVDDLRPARPQSGFSDASVVWHAPAEGGIPRYMLIFQELIPGDVGPVRSARPYFIDWASELSAVYVHVGGSPQALAQLRESGGGQQVYNADEFRFGGKYLWRVQTRSSPHNVYTDGEHLRELAGVVGASDGAIAWPWRFGPGLAPAIRPVGGRIEVGYPYNTVRYTYDRRTNTYRRAVTGEKRQIDAATDQPVAPRNVVVMRVPFAALADQNPSKGRLGAQLVGTGKAWIATNGHTIEGAWRKRSATAPTEFLDAAGEPVVLTIGQTFIQVIPLSGELTVRDGRPASVNSPEAGPMAS